MQPWYATREDVMSATDVKVSARNSVQLDADLEAASRTAELLTHRRYYPWSGTRYFDWPADQGGRSYRIWFDQYDLISLTSIANGDGSTVPTANVFLDPQDGPPYTSAEVSQNTTSAFAAGGTWQRAVGFTGLWGSSNDQTSAGTLAAGINASTTAVTVSDSSVVGVGSLLTVGAERMIVTARATATTTATLGASLLSSAGADAVTVSSGALVHAGEFITVGTEIMQVYAVTGNVLSVKRAVQGTTLAAHTLGDTVYAPRALTVARGATGTTAATASLGDAVTVWVPPGPIHNFTVALATSFGQQRTGGWTKEADAALDALTEQVRAAYGRYRTAAV